MTPNDLSDNALALLSVLRDIRGRENATLARKLAHRIGLRLSGAKRVADAARELRLLGYPIGSCGQGYYWMTDYSEAMSVYKQHVNRGRAHFRTAAMMRAEFPALPPIEQETLQFDELEV